MSKLLTDEQVVRIFAAKVRAKITDAAEVAEAVQFARDVLKCPQIMRRFAVWQLIGTNYTNEDKT